MLRSFEGDVETDKLKAVFEQLAFKGVSALRCISLPWHPQELCAGYLFVEHQCVSLVASLFSCAKWIQRNRNPCPATPWWRYNPVTPANGYNESRHHLTWISSYLAAWELATKMLVLLWQLLLCEEADLHLLCLATKTFKKYLAACLVWSCLSANRKCTFSLKMTLSHVGETFCCNLIQQWILRNLRQHLGTDWDELGSGNTSARL